MKRLLYNKEKINLQVVFSKDQGSKELIEKLNEIVEYATNEMTGSVNMEKVAYCIMEILGRYGKPSVIPEIVDYIWFRDDLELVIEDEGWSLKPV